MNSPFIKITFASILCLASRIFATYAPSFLVSRIFYMRLLKDISLYSWRKVDTLDQTDPGHTSCLDDFLSKGRHDKFNSKHPNKMTRISDELHDHMSFTIGQAASYRCTYAWRVYWIESIHIKAQVNAVTSFSC